MMKIYLITVNFHDYASNMKISFNLNKPKNTGVTDNVKYGWDYGESENGMYLQES